MGFLTTATGGNRSALLFLLGCAFSGGCGSNFTSETLIDSVRVLAVSADPPYAPPGTTVKMDMLAFDGRPTQPAPMVTSWLPQVCFDPPGDNYYGCFPAFAGSFRDGADLTSALTAGSSFSFTMPEDVITSHSSTRGADAYGLAVVFSFACAGHVEYTPSAAGDRPDGVPFGCFDASGARLGADSFVFSYAQVYAFTDRKNANPVITGLTYQGQIVSPSAGIPMARCTRSSIDDCPKASFDTVVPASSQEPDPGASSPGRAVKEEIWVDYYLTAGKVKNETVILYDPLAGKLSGTVDDLSTPQRAGDAELWAVVHDNRGGVSWEQVTMHVQ